MLQLSKNLRPNTIPNGARRCCHGAETFRFEAAENMVTYRFDGCPTGWPRSPNPSHRPGRSPLVENRQVGFYTSDHPVPYIFGTKPPQLPIYQVFEPLVPNILRNWKVRVYYSLAVWICQSDSLFFSTIWDWFITILRWEYVWVMFVENHFNLIKSVNNMFQDHRKSQVTVICPELTTSWL